MTNLKVK